MTSATLTGKTPDSAATVRVRVVYLARLRDALGTAGEVLPLEGHARIADVIDVLRARGGAFARELGEGRAVRIALNHALASSDAVVHDGDEVAFLPPVTGG
jgi:molybdopterin synthase sulfur carrier subunit